MSWKETYKKMLEQTAPAAIEHFPLRRAYLLLQEHWWQGLAVLEMALTLADKERYRQQLIDLYELLFLEDLDFKASADLTGEDYDFYFHQAETILEEMALLYPHAYTQLAFLYQDPRVGYKDTEKLKAYLEKAAALHVAVAPAVMGYFYVTGWNFQKDEELGMSYLRDTSNLWVQLYLGYIELSRNETDGIPDYFRALQVADDVRLQRNGLILEALYHKQQDNAMAAFDCYSKILETYESPYALLQAGLYLLFKEQPERERALEYLERAASLGNIEAMNNYGYHAYPATVNTATDLALVFRHFSKAAEHGNAYAAYRCALIYLYEPLYKDMEKGLGLLQQAIDGRCREALAEMAELLLGGELMERDDERAYRYHRIAAEELNYGYSFYRLGLMEERGLNQAGASDSVKALEYFEKAAALGEPQGFSNAGRCHRSGTGTFVDNAKAREYYEKGMEYGLAYCATELGYMYEDGTIAQDYNKAFELFTAAAEMQGGYGYAYFIKGQYLQNGYHNQIPDPAAAFDAFAQGAALGSVGAIYELGRCYRYGVGVNADPDLALEHYRTAAGMNYIQAYVEMALCYEYEAGVSFDAVKVFDWMLKAAEEAYPYAMYKVGTYLIHGSLGEAVPPDMEQGFEWLMKAAENGHPYACLELGDYFLYDYADRKEYHHAVDFYTKAYEKDVINEGFGLCYYYGLGVDYHAGDAFKYFEIAAHKDNVAAMYRLGKCYLEGEGVKKQEERAFHWLYQAAGQQHSLAQYEAGKMLLEGKGTPVNKAEGFALLRQAAENEVADAQFETGNCYLMGESVDEDEAQAMHWYEKAAGNGHKHASRIVGRPMR